MDPKTSLAPESVRTGKATIYTNNLLQMTKEILVLFVGFRIYPSIKWMEGHDSLPVVPKIFHGVL